MDDGDGVREVHEEIRRLSDRFYAAVLLDIFTRYCRRQSGFDLSDSTPGTKTVHVAVSWALELNTLAHLCFVVVMARVVGAPVVLERMRRIQQDSDVNLVLGFTFLLISSAFFAYLRWFVHV
ncbi:unnamed protein product [Thlaspi arvense]|uniref:Uncharacterized protein n=1 Tax=Thlaspi arvense TaxID=13288 RepID=A0AAU9R4K4_THLAR|nr:unnamed protein product [Thlaspi arvense]